MLRVFLLLAVLLISHAPAGQVSVAQQVVNYTLPFSSADLVYYFGTHWAVKNGTTIVVSGKVVNGTKLVYLPKWDTYVILRNDGALVAYEYGAFEKVLAYGPFDGFTVDVSQDFIYAWRNSTLYVVHMTGSVIYTRTFNEPIAFVLAYVNSKAIAVVMQSKMVYLYRYYTDSTPRAERNVTDLPLNPNIVALIYYGGDYTLLYPNGTHVILWRLYYNTKLVFEADIKPTKMVYFPYWDGALLLWNSTKALFVFRVARSDRQLFYLNMLIYYATIYIGYKSVLWGDPPFVMIASNFLRVLYYDKNAGTWKSNDYNVKIPGAFMVFDNDMDGAPEIYYVADGKLMNTEVTLPTYIYDYRAVIPAMELWFGNVYLLDRGAWDWDGDRLENFREINELSSSIVLKDSDHDGISDYDEAVEYLTDPTSDDTDHDGISDYDEIFVYKTDPKLADTDEDFVPDGREIEFGTNPLSNDTDKDGLTDYGEIFVYHTDPTTDDTDKDGLTDYLEIMKYKTNPTKEDSDGDGLTDYEEIMKFGTNPLTKDSDGDGLTDYEEIMKFGTNPLNSDTDGDGYPDGGEVLMGFDPKDKKSNPKSYYYVAKTFYPVFILTFIAGMLSTIISMMVFILFRRVGVRRATPQITLS